MRYLFKKSKLMLLVSAILVLGLVLTACGRGDKITIGAKNFTESRTLATMLQILIEEKTDLKAEIKEFGGTQLVFEALKSNSIDLYPEYTGTAYTVMLNGEKILSPDETYEIVKKEFSENFNLEWLGQFGFNNTYTLTVRKDMAKELDLKTFSDLKKHEKDLVLGATMEFLERSDGYEGLKKVYGFEFKDTKGLDPGLTYMAARDGQVDVIDAFATDGRIQAFNLQVLEDDKNFFPPYYAAPLVSNKLLEKYPELKEVLNLLEGAISDTDMRELNYAVDELEESPEKVARELLKSKGII